MAQAAQTIVLAVETSNDLSGNHKQAWLTALAQQELEGHDDDVHACGHRDLDDGLTGPVGDDPRREPMHTVHISARCRACSLLIDEVPMWCHHCRSALHVNCGTTCLEDRWCLAFLCLDHERAHTCYVPY